MKVLCDEAGLHDACKCCLHGMEHNRWSECRSIFCGHTTRPVECLDPDQNKVLMNTLGAQLHRAVEEFKAEVMSHLPRFIRRMLKGKDDAKEI